MVEQTVNVDALQATTKSSASDGSPRNQIALLKCIGRSTWIGRWSLEPLERPTLEHLERPMVAGAAVTAYACINS